MAGYLEHFITERGNQLINCLTLNQNKMDISVSKDIQIRYHQLLHIAEQERVQSCLAIHRKCNNDNTNRIWEYWARVF